MPLPTPLAAPLLLPIEALDAAAFAPFGEVIEAHPEGLRHPINEGTAERFHDLARIDTGAAGGRTLLSIFRAQARPLPLRVQLLERHLLGSQAFMPLQARPFLVVVAAAGPAPGRGDLRCFLAAPGQGVNFTAGTWHHPLIALEGGGDFLVIDRGGPEADVGAEAGAAGAIDCEDIDLTGLGLWIGPPADAWFGSC